MSQISKASISGGGVPANVPTSFVLDMGTAVPSLNVLDINGGTSIQVVKGAGNQVIINSLFNPNAVVRIFDDFIGVCSGTGTGIDSELQWALSGSNVAVSPDIFTGLSNTHPGVINTDFASPSPSQFTMTLGGLENLFTPSFILGGGVLTMNWVIKVLSLSTLANRYQLFFGLGDSSVITQVIPANGVYFNYSDNVNAGNWQAITGTASTYTTTNTAIAASTAAFHNFGMSINAAASSIVFTIDGTTVATISTNIPTAAQLTPFISVLNTSGTLGDGQPLAMDLFYLQQILTTPR